MAYDPQRNRARAQPSADEPAPVDLVLGAPEPGPVQPDPLVEGALPPAEPVPETGPAPAPRPPTEHELSEHGAVSHEHGPDCDHEHDHGPDLRLIVAAGLATVAAAALVLRRRRTARR